MKIKEFCEKYKEYEYKDQKEFKDMIKKVDCDCILYAINGNLVLLCYKPDIDEIIDDEVFCAIIDPSSNELFKNGGSTLHEVSEKINELIEQKSKNINIDKSFELMKNMIQIIINSFLLGSNSDKKIESDINDNFELDIYNTFVNGMVDNMYRDFEETYLKDNTNLDDIKTYRDVLGIFALKVDKKYKELTEKE